MATHLAHSKALFASDLFADDSTQKEVLGTRGFTADGRRFRYGKAGALALTPGFTQQTAAVTSTHENCAVAAAAAIGATTVTLTLGNGAVTANQYSGGYLVVNDVTGEGNTYQISSHPAANASASLTVTLFPEDKIRVALDTTSEVSLLQDKFNGIIVVPATPTGTPVGVGVKAVTALYYGWIIDQGPTSCLCAGTGTIGNAATIVASGTEGAVAPGAADTNIIVGSFMQAGVSTEYRLINLEIA